MKLILTTIAMILLLTTCRSRTKNKDRTETEIVKIEQIAKDSTILSSQNDLKTVEKTENTQNNKSEKQTDFQVKGKAETDRPIEIYHVENGDTLQTFRVVGNADVFIRSKNYTKIDNFTNDFKESFSNKLEHISRAVVKEKNIRKAAETIKKETVSVKTKGFVTPIYIAATIAIIVALCLLFIGWKLEIFKK